MHSTRPHSTRSSSTRFLLTLFAAFLASAPIAAHALPGEAAAVIAQCGQPQAESRETSAVTGKLQRDLIYRDLTLHFEPLEGGWSFTTGWQGHFPISRTSLEAKLPCFRTAMQQVAAAPREVIDPTIAAQTTGTAPLATSTWGIPHLWFIALLIVGVLFIVIFPRRRTKTVSRSPESRPYRRPVLRGRIWRRRPTDIVDPPVL